MKNILIRDLSIHVHSGRKGTRTMIAWNRIISTLLACCLLVGLLPTTALAASTTTVNSASELQSAINNAGNGDTIKLGANITFNSASQIKTVADVYQDRKNLTYELEAQHRRQKSYTIVGIDWDWEDVDDPAWQEATADYQLPEEFRPEHSSEGTGGINANDLWIRNGKLARENGDILYVHEDGDATTYLLIDGKNLTIDLNGHTINATHNDAYFSALFVTGGSTVTIKGNGGITSSNTAITANGSGTTVDIQGGSFTGYTAVAAIYNATVNITGGSFTGKNVTERVVSTTVSLDKTSEYTIHTAEGNPLWQGLLLNSGYSYRAEWEYRGTAKRTVNCATLYCENYGAINVSGNPTVKAPSGGTLFYVPGSWTVGYTTDFGTYISGGTFEGSMKKGSACATGGAFSENPQGVITGLGSGVLPQFRDCMVEKTADGKYDVVSQEEWNSRGYVAAIGDIGYDSLDAAINDAENGNWIRLLKDIAGPLTLSKAKTYTLDLESHTINDYVTVKAGNVTITDGTINYTGTGNALKTEGDSAVLTADCTVYAPSGVALSAGYGSTNGGTVNVTGGEYTGRLGTAAGGILSITGGKFKNDPSAYVAEGYVAKKGADDWYTVRVGVPVTSMEIWNKDDLLAFKAEVEKGADADVDGILMANINLSETTWDPIGLDPSVSYRGTFDGNGYSIQNLNSTTGGLFHKISAKGTVCNLRIASGTISSSSNVGAIADECGGTIVDCSNAASVTCNGGDSAYVYAGGIVGAYGTIRRCSNSGTITGSHAVGGIMGGNGSNILNCYDCYNTGKLVYSGPANKSSSGIYGIGNSNASNCYNTGVMSYTNKPNSIRNIASMSVTKGYYVTSYYVSNGGSTSESTENPDGTQKTAEQFASGEVAWLLNNESADGPWYQNLSGSGKTADSYPVLDPTHLRVYKTTRNQQYTNISYSSVNSPSAMTVSYGTSARILAQLPATVEVRGVADIDYRSYYYDVEWDMDSSGFDPQSLESQTITIPGKVNVTDMTNGGVKNVSIQVTVAAPGISSLELDAAPTLTYEAGASLNLSGTRVSAIYVNSVVVNLTDATEGVTFSYADGTTLSKATHDGRTLFLTYKGKTVQLGKLDVLSTDNTIQTLKVHGETAAYADGAYTVTLPPDSSLPSSADDISVTPRDTSATVVSKVQGDSAAVWQITVRAENGVEAVYPLHIDIAPPYANQNEAAIADITSKWNALTKSWTAAQADIQRDDVKRPGENPDPAYLSHDEILNEWVSGQVYTALAIPKELEDYISIDVTFGDPVSWAIAGARADHDGTDGSFGFTVTVTASKGVAADHKTATLTGGSGIITATPYDVPDYTVQFDSQSGSAVASITVKEDTPIGDAAPADPTRADYRFTGWYKEAACTTKWDMQTDIVEGNMTLYAGWIEVFPVNLPTGDGYTIAPAPGSASPVDSGGSYRFTVEIWDGSKQGENFAVKVNDTELIPGADGTYTLENITAAQTITVEGVVDDIPTTYTIGLSASPATGGSVSGGGTFDENTSVTVTASPASGYAFVRWTEDGQEVSTDASYTFTVTAARSLVAEFVEDTPPAPQKVTITATAGANGQISPVSVELTIGASAIFTITPDSGYEVASVTVDGADVTSDVDANGQYTFNDVKADHAISATFKEIPAAPTPPKTYEITATADANGSISPASQTVPEGGSATFTITPNSSYVIDTVTLDGNDVTGQVSNGQYTLSNITEGHSINATFKVMDSGPEPPTITYHTITATAGENGSISPGNASVPEGGSAVFTITPDSNYEVEKVTVDGTDVMGQLQNGQYTFSDVQANHTISVTFKEIPAAPTPPTTYTITATADANGSISPTSQTVPEGGSAIFTITPDGGYEIDKVTLDNTDVTDQVADGQYTLSNPTGNHNISVTFKQIVVTSYTVSVSADPAMGGSVSGSGSFLAGTSATVTATPHAGYRFVKWTEGSTEVSASTSYTFEVTKSRTLVAVFERVRTYSITVQTEGNGTASASLPVAEAGTTITLTATPTSGYHFKEWVVVSGGVTIGGDTFTMPDGPVIIKAVFEKDTPTPVNYQITVQTEGSGTASASPSKATQGTEITLTATPGSGYHFKEWVVVSGNVSIGGNKFRMPNGHVTIKAVFEEDAPAAGHTHNFGSWTSGGDGTHTRTCSEDSSHTEIGSCYGGTATCKDLAACSLCGGSHGAKDSSNHTGGTEVRGAYAATSTQAGYTGDTYCLGCGVKIKNGSVIPATGDGGGGGGGGYTPPYDDGDDNDDTPPTYDDDDTPSTPSTPPTPPVVQPETEKSDGWEEIKNELQDLVDQLDAGNTKPGETVTVDMNGATEVPSEVLKEIAGKDVNVEFDMGGGITWTVNGKDIPQGIGDLNLGITTGSNTIPVSVINALTGEVSTMQLTLSHSGPFGTVLHLSIELGSEYHGLWANLYYFDDLLKELVFQHACFIDRNGGAIFPFDHASSYAIVIDEENHDPDGDKTNPNTGGGNPFTDVNDTDWFYEDVLFVYYKGIMLGTSDTTFGPNGTATRGMMATVLWRMEGSPAPAGKNPFTDVPDSEYYADAITWANEQGIFVGYGGGMFGPNDPITREQLAAIFYRYAEYKGYDLTPTDSLERFTDKDEVADWAQDAAKWAVGSGLMFGTTDTTFAPKATATRAQIAAMLHRFIEKYGLEERETYTGLTGWVDPTTDYLTPPQMGGSSHGGLWTGLALFAAAGSTATFFYRRRRKKDNDHPTPTPA